MIPAPIVYTLAALRWARRLPIVEQWMRWRAALAVSLAPLRREEALRRAADPPVHDPRELDADERRLFPTGPERAMRAFLERADRDFGGDLLALIRHDQARQGERPS